MSETEFFGENYLFWVKILATGLLKFQLCNIARSDFLIMSDLFFVKQAAMKEKSVLSQPTLFN